MEQKIKEIQKQAGNKKVFLLVSGGVDSTVTFALLEKALGADNVFGLFVDTGFMRKGERKEVKNVIKKIGFKHFHIYDGGKEFFSALKGAYEPEAKRKIIGDQFLKIQREVTKELGLNPKEWLLGQGTIYPDTIESGGTRHSEKIKTHHNRVPKIEELIKQGKIIEPVKELYKDEVREIGENLGLPEEFVWRHPFPGPGLAVRVLCTKKKTVPQDRQQIEGRIKKFLKERFALGRDLDAHLSVSILPIQSVGVQGDARTYRHPVAICCKFQSWKLFEAMSTAITNKFKEVNRVVCCLTECINNERLYFTLKYDYLTPERIELLQKADKIVMDFIKEEEIDREIWQFPTILIPVTVSGDKTSKEQEESIILRPVASQEAMTANFYQMDIKLLRKLVLKLKKIPGISGIFYDLTNKPPGTIEWE